MRKWIGIAVMAVFLAGCGAQPAGSTALAPDALEIKDKMFLAQVNEVYLNADDYMGKPIRYEGVFDQYPYGEADAMYRSVIRYGPGCCGDDANVGFEVVWDKDYPSQGDWVAVQGVLERYDEDGQTYLRLRCDRLETLPTRGNDTVSQ